MPQYSGMFDDFLMTDINENVDFCDEVLTAINRSTIRKNSFCGNVYELKISGDKAILANLHDDEITPETINLSELQQRLNNWREKLLRVKIGSS
jgi:hypothetical protein